MDQERVANSSSRGRKKHLQERRGEEKSDLDGGKKKIALEDGVSRA